MAVEVENFPTSFLFWRSDEDLPANATMLFDRALAGSTCLTVLLAILADDVLELGVFAMMQNPD